MYLASRRAEGTAKTEAKCGRLWFNDGSCVRLRPERAKHVWSYDFFSAHAHDGRSVRILNLIDEYTRDRLMVLAERRWSSSRVISALADVMVRNGVPEHPRSDNGPEFAAMPLRKWLAGTGAKTLYIEPGSPWENGYCEIFNSQLRDELLNGEIFYSMKELCVLAERCASTTTPSGRTPRRAAKPPGDEKAAQAAMNDRRLCPAALLPKLANTNTDPNTNVTFYRSNVRSGQCGRSLLGSADRVR